MKLFKITSNDEVTPLKDEEYLKILQSTLAEWDSSYDEEDYQHLQD